MKRRDVIALLGVIAAWPLIAHAQSTPKPAARAKTDDAADKLEPLIQPAEALGAPIAAVKRAYAISRQATIAKKDVLAVFDISQPSASKRFYLFDLKAGQVTAH